MSQDIYFPTNAGVSVDNLMEMLEDADISVPDVSSIPSEFFQQMVNALHTIQEDGVDDMREEDINHERRYALRELVSEFNCFK